MAFTFAQSIANARVIFSDSAVPYRYADATLFSFAKDGVVEMVTLSPDLFEVRGNISCVAGQLVQTLPNAGRSLYLIDIYESQIAGVRKPLFECSFEVLRRFRPTYMTDTAAPAENWMRFPSNGDKRDDTKFYIYPTSPTGQLVTASWTEVPDLSATVIGDAVPVSDDYAPAMEKYIAYRAEMVNDEAQVRARALEHYQEFRGLMGAAKAEKE